MDVGGKTAASEAADATEVWQEGLLLPLKPYCAGVPARRRALRDVNRANVRVPKETLGDIRAQIAAAASGASPRSVSVTAPTRCRADIADMWDSTEAVVRDGGCASGPTAQAWIPTCTATACCASRSRSPCERGRPRRLHRTATAPQAAEPQWPAASTILLLRVVRPGRRRRAQGPCSNRILHPTCREGEGCLCE